MLCAHATCMILTCACSDPNKYLLSVYSHVLAHLITVGSHSNIRCHGRSAERSRSIEDRDIELSSFGAAVQPYVGETNNFLETDFSNTDGAICKDIDCIYYY